MIERNVQELDKLLKAVTKSSKYKAVSPNLIKMLGSQELTKRRNVKAAIKSTKNKLHQVGGAYLEQRINYSQWIDELRKIVKSGNKDDLLKVCFQIMSYHSSTRERLTILEQFYTEILAQLHPVTSVLDVACGLNPLAIPWMPLASNVTYYACDIYQDLIQFLNNFMEIIEIQGCAKVSNLIQQVPPQQVDVAFILKTIPCLEQLDKNAGRRLLEAINANYLVVSFPVHSLGGRDKGMAVNYEAKFNQMISQLHWSIQKLEFPTELVFIVTK